MWSWPRSVAGLLGIALNAWRRPAGLFKYMSWIRKIFGITPSLSFDNLFDVPMIPPGVTTVEQVAEMIKDATHDSGIVVMVGAGMSTAAGTPLDKAKQCH